MFRVFVLTGTVLLLAVSAASPSLMAGASAAPAEAPAAAGPAVRSAAADASLRAAAATSATDAQRAHRVLDELARRYRFPDDVTVSIGRTPRGEQAVAYYAGNRIVVDSAHTADIGVILAHEIWHIIDWRDNGRLDWGEQLPSANSYAYVTG